MPFGPYENWEACIQDQIRKGKNALTAKRICGSLKKKLEMDEESIEVTPNEPEIINLD